MNILVTGGAGYIGSHIVKQLLKYQKYKITIIDNLSTGLRSTITTLQNLGKIEFINEDLKNIDKIDELFREKKFHLIIHLAASSIVSESVNNSTEYYLNNICVTTNLIHLANKYEVDKFIFSSTAAVYGELSKKYSLLSEEDICSPLNPYGFSKFASEQVLIDNIQSNQSFQYVILRYFNVAGADKDLLIGESHDPETHLIPLVAKAALGITKSISLYGNDYDTKDGTCIRDYIHVDDLAHAHLSAIDYLENTCSSNIFNCGYGFGFSVQEIINTMKKISGADLKVEIKDRRAGDVSFLVSDNRKIMEHTTWKPNYNNLEYICESTLSWEKIKNINPALENKNE